MALVPTKRPFVLNGRLKAIGIPLSGDEAAALSPSQRALCVDAPSVQQADSPPNNSLPAMSSTETS